MYPKSDGPQYIPGGSTNAVVCLLVASLALGLRYLHQWENKKLEKAEEAVGEEGGDVGVADDAGGAGRRAVGFRYIY